MKTEKNSRLARNNYFIGRGFEGYTLIEILVVVVIIAILSAIVVPHFAGASDLQALAAAKILSADLQYAQSFAECNQTIVVVTFDCVNGSYTLATTGGDLLTHPISKSDYIVVLSEQSGTDLVTCDSADFAGTSTISFNPSGKASSDGTVELVAGRATCTVTVVKATGRILVQ